MRRGIAFALLFLLVFSLALAVRLPLNWALAVLPKSLHCAQPQGSLWSGRCQGLALSTLGLSVDQIDWTLRPRGLLQGRLVLDVTVHRDDATLTGRVQRGKGRIEILGARGSGHIPPGLPAPAAGWTGHVALEGLNLHFVRGQLDALEGRITARDLKSPQGTAWGSYELVVPRPAATGIAPGRLVSLEGPLRLEGSLALDPAQRSWSLDARAAVQPGADPALERALSALGPADAQGLRPLSVAGAY